MRRPWLDAAPGSDFVRYGGHTSCVAVAADGRAPTLLLDAGAVSATTPRTPPRNRGSELDR